MLETLCIVLGKAVGCDVIGCDIMSCSGEVGGVKNDGVRCGDEVEKDVVCMGCVICSGVKCESGISV